MALSVNNLRTFLDNFHAYVDADNWTSAEKELTKAEVELQSMPNTDQARWRGMLDSAYRMLEKLRDRDEYQGRVVYSGHRNKQRSTE